MSRKYALIVEGDDTYRQALNRELEELVDYQIVLAKDGVQAYQKTRNQKFEVIVTDFNIQKLNASQLIGAARETKLNLFTPFIILSIDNEEAKKSTRGIQGITYLQKPIEFKNLAIKMLEASVFDPDKKSFKLDVDFINPFINSSIRTLNELCSATNINALKPELLQDENLEIDISGVLAISSPYFKGSIAISFKENVYKAIIEQIMTQNTEGIELDTNDGVAEIINIIFGQTKAILNQKGYALERALPTVELGNNHKRVQDSKTPVLLVPFESSLGNFWIQICVKAI